MGKGKMFIFRLFFLGEAWWHLLESNFWCIHPTRIVNSFNDTIHRKKSKYLPILLHLLVTLLRLWKFLQHTRYIFLFINLHIEINGILDLQLLTLQFPGHIPFREHILVCCRSFYTQGRDMFYFTSLKRLWHICICKIRIYLFITFRLIRVHTFFF